LLAALSVRPAAYLIAVVGIPGAGKTTFSAQML
jgi:KaiC/GvpD/RAD55 family RecA-like ATPase